MTTNTPYGTEDVSGIANRRSPLTVKGTVDRLTEVIGAAGAKVFAIVDHSGEAASVGQSLRETKVVIFGNPVAGTPVMRAAPLSALDLPLKILVWADDEGAVWMSYLTGEWLSSRHGVTADLAKPLSAPDLLAARVSDPPAG